MGSRAKGGYGPAKGTLGAMYGLVSPLCKLGAVRGGRSAVEGVEELGKLRRGGRRDKGGGGGWGGGGGRPGKEGRSGKRPEGRAHGMAEAGGRTPRCS